MPRGTTVVELARMVRLRGMDNPLEFLVGTWRGEGVGAVPGGGGPDYPYSEELRIFSDGTPWLAYSSRIVSTEDGRWLHSESGWWRPQPAVEGVEGVEGAKGGVVGVEAGPDQPDRGHRGAPRPAHHRTGGGTGRAGHRCCGADTERARSDRRPAPVRRTRRQVDVRDRPRRGRQRARALPSRPRSTEASSEPDRQVWKGVRPIDAGFPVR